MDLAVDTDRGGSCRIPASFCGMVGMKPTYGHARYTGVVPIDITIDYVGEYAGMPAPPDRGQRNRSWRSAGIT